MSEFYGFNFKPDCYYIEHIWAKVEPDGNVRVGFDDVVARGSHDIFLIKVALLKTVVQQKKKMGIIESTKYTGPIIAPVSGTIVQVNGEVRKYGARIIGKDPYGEGWLAVIEPSSLESDLKNLLYGDAAVEWFKKEAEKAQFELEHGAESKK